MTADGEAQAWLADLLLADPTDACIEWPFYRMRKGYGQVGQGRKVRLVTHVVLERTGRPRPELPGPHGACALHSCDNPPCVNPAHLRWGTNRENVNDMVQRDRQQRVAGERKPAAKLTWTQVREIRDAFAAGAATKAELARRYAVTQPTIKCVIDGTTWKENA